MLSFQGVDGAASRYWKLHGNFCLKHPIGFENFKAFPVPRPAVCCALRTWVSALNADQVALLRSLPTENASLASCSMLGRKSNFGPRAPCANFSQEQPVRGIEDREAELSALPARPGGYTPFEYVTFSQDQLTHEVTVKVFD